MYEYVLPLMPAVFQGHAGTSASVPVQNLITPMSHLRIPIPKTSCLLHAIGLAKIRTRLIVAWQLGCAAACGRARNLPQHH